MTDRDVIVVGTKKEADRAVEFLCSAAAFSVEMTEWRKRARQTAVMNSLNTQRHCFWCIENDKDHIIGTVGVCENERENGGYYLDYFAVHQEYRRQGIGSRLLRKAESFVCSASGRYILIDTGSSELWTAARKFYEAQGYRRVSFIPDYFDIGESRTDYYKKV